MKRYYFLFVVLALSINNTFAQSCYEKTRTKGINAYNNGEYKTARDYFNFAKANCDDKPADNDLNEWIKKCNQKIAEVEVKVPKQRGVQRKSEVPDTPDYPDKSWITSNVQTTLTVSTNNVSFDASGEQNFPITISTNVPVWGISNDIGWCSVTQPTSSSLRLVCLPNTDAAPRSDFFYITAGSRSEKIVVYQGAAANPAELGNKLYSEGKYDEARKLYMAGDERNNPEAQYRLGKMYLEGAGVVINRTKAMELFKKSAASNYSRGENALGYMYETQEYPDYEEAVKWYRKSADQGNAIAQYNLGMMYKYGLGVKKSGWNARKWLKKSAKQGLQITERN